MPLEILCPLRNNNPRSIWGGGIEFSHNPQHWWRKKKIDHHLHTIPAFLNLSLYPKADCQFEVLCQQNNTLQLFVSSKSQTHTFSLFCSCILPGIFLNNWNNSFFFFFLFPKDTKVWLRRCDYIHTRQTLRINIPPYTFSQWMFHEKARSLFCRTVLSTLTH